MTFDNSIKRGLLSVNIRIFISWKQLAVQHEILDFLILGSLRKTVDRTQQNINCNMLILDTGNVYQAV